jgi:hypothetical protein
MSSSAPIECAWDGEVLRPVSPYWGRRADKQWAKGEVLRIVDQPERSHGSHAHFFAMVQETWRNLPPLLAERFHSPDHLRRYALIRAGFCDAQVIACGSKAVAAQVAAAARKLDEFSLAEVKGSVVHIFTPHSQSYQAMDRARFKESKERVLDVLAEMIGVARQELSDNAGRAA